MKERRGERVFLEECNDGRKISREKKEFANLAKDTISGFHYTAALTFCFLISTLKRGTARQQLHITLPFSEMNQDTDAPSSFSSSSPTQQAGRRLVLAALVVYLGVSLTAYSRSFLQRRSKDERKSARPRQQEQQQEPPLSAIANEDEQEEGALPTLNTSSSTSSSSFTCYYRPCPVHLAHRNIIVADHYGQAGLNDRLSIYQSMTSLAGYLCATLQVPAPTTSVCMYSSTMVHHVKGTAL